MGVEAFAFMNDGFTATRSSEITWPPSLSLAGLGTRWIGSTTTVITSRGTSDGRPGPRKLGTNVAGAGGDIDGSNELLPSIKWPLIPNRPVVSSVPFRL
jgi:hypothetical protein